MAEHHDKAAQHRYRLISVPVLLSAILFFNAIIGAIAMPGMMFNPGDHVHQHHGMASDHGHTRHTAEATDHHNEASGNCHHECAEALSCAAHCAQQTPVSHLQPIIIASISYLHLVPLAEHPTSASFSRLFKPPRV